MANKILQIDLQNDITPQIGSYDNTGGVTPNNWQAEGGVYSLGPTNRDGTTPYYWFTPTREVTDFDLCWEDYQDHSQTTPQYHLEIGDSAGNVVLSALRTNANYSIGPVGVGAPAYRTWHKILIEVRKASASSSTVTAYVDGKKVATGTSGTLLTSAKIALLGHVPDSYYWQNAGQRLRYVTIYDRSYTSKGINLDGMMTIVTGLISKLIAKLSTVALTGSYNDLSDKPTISTVNDGTLTIQKNGTNVATFTANQSTAATANITVPTAVSELTNDSGYLTSSSNLDASKLTSGTVDIARLPQGALERLVKVANEAARYALTTADVQLGDTVQQLDTGIMYIVTDDDHLDSAAGYTEYTAGTAASVPWSGVTGKPTFAAVATSGAYSDLTGTPTIPTVNNATLTIQQNGTNVQTFTANQSTNATANITVPTKTSDLTNDSGFITSDNTKIPLAGSNQISGSLIPSTNGTVNLGGPSYQWNQAYIKSLTINGVACGDILTHNASEFVDVSSNQTISGLKSFNDVGRYYIDVGTKSTNFLNFKIFNIELDSETNLPTKGYTFSQNITSANPALYLGNYYSVTTQGITGTDIRNYKYDSNKDYAGISIRYTLNDDSYIHVKCNRFIPIENNATVLGSPSLQWNNTYTRNILIDNDINIASSLINKTSSSGVLSIRGGLTTPDGASIGLYGKDYNGAIAGNIYMTAYGNSDYTNFRIYPNGAMTVYNNSTATTKNVAMQEDVIPLAGSNQISGSLIPATDNSVNLGTSTNKWKSFNGINPGALSLPSISNTGVNAWIALDTTDWVKNASVSNAQKYIPLADGWLNVRVDNATMLAIAVGGNYMHQLIRSETPNGLALLIPVFKNTEVAIMVSGNENLSYNRATFYYCQGNV